MLNTKLVTLKEEYTFISIAFFAKEIKKISHFSSFCKKKKKTRLTNDSVYSVKIDGYKNYFSNSYAKVKGCAVFLFSKTKHSEFKT